MSRSSLPSSSDIARQVGDSRFTVRPAGWRMAETVSMPPPEDILTIYSLSESYSAERSAPVADFQNVAHADHFAPLGFTLRNLFASC